MRIGGLGRATGVNVETIRYYEKAGLLPEPARGANGYREYSAQHLERLAFIRHCRALGIGLADVRRLLDFSAHADADCSDVNLLIDQQLARVRTRLESLKALEQQLIVLRGRCKDGRVAAECGILQELVTAAQNETHA